MTLLAFLVLAGLAAIAGLWPMALAAFVLGLLLHGAQRADSAVWVEDSTADETPGAGKALVLLVMWLAVGLAGLVVLGLATTEVLR